ncbi:MAG: hypothetical protein V1799_05745 [bacterium]
MDKPLIVIVYNGTMDRLTKAIPPKLIAAGAVLLLALPVVVYTRLVFLYMVNIPFHDDYEIILDFMNKYLQADTLGEKLSLLFSQHNEHRMVFGRIVALVQYSLRQEISLNDSLLIGNLGWICAIAIIMIVAQKHYRLTLVQLLPIPFILLIPTHWETMVFASAAANYWVIVFSLVFILCVVHDRFVGACLFYLAALLTFGNGLLLGLLGLWFWGRQKRWKPFFVFGALMVVSTLLYYVNYQKPVDHPMVFETITQPGAVLSYIVLFWGSILPMKIPAFLFGLGMIIYAILHMLKRNRDHFLIMIILFVALTSLAAAITRSGFGIEQALSSRNSIYALLLVACCYISMITSISQTQIRNGVALVMIFLAILFWHTNAARYETKLSLRKSDRIAGFAKLIERKDPASLIHPDQMRAAAILFTAESLHVYQYKHWNR